MIIISRNVFQPNFSLIPINAVNSSRSAFQPREPNLKHEQVSNWYIIGDCTLLLALTTPKHLLLTPFQQTNCCFVVPLKSKIDWHFTAMILDFSRSTMLQ